MKIPRDCTGLDLAKALRRFGYEVIRQTGSHLRLTTVIRGEHHITIPNHSPLKIGLLNSLLKDIARHHEISIETLVRDLNL